MRTPVAAFLMLPGCIMFEMAGIDEPTAREALGLAAHKLPIPTKFVTRAGGL